MGALADVLAADALYPHPERLVPFAGNHDTSRLAEVVRILFSMRNPAASSGVSDPSVE
jgi:hypothetical protein